jgi:hypothetical protein
MKNQSERARGLAPQDEIGAADHEWIRSREAVGLGNARVEPGFRGFAVEDEIGRQGRSGLGIEGQRAAVTRFAKTGGFTVIAEFGEIETGKVPMRSKGDLSSPPRWHQAARASARSLLPSSIGCRAMWPSLPA